MYVRHAARVVLFDPNGHVLLVRSRCGGSPAGADWAWFLPGGGVEAGETLHQAAVREVGEEAGIDISDQYLTHLAFAEGRGSVGEVAGIMRDDIFAASVESPDVVPEDGIGQLRWWPLTDLHKITEPVFPLLLAETLDRFLSAEEWPGPVRLPW